MAITDDRDILRLEIGDTNPASYLFADDELDVYLARYPGRVLAAAADCCDALARRFAADLDTSITSGVDTVRRQQTAARVASYRELAADLRRRNAGTAAPFFGGNSLARKDDLASDTDRAQPAFRRGQFSVNGDSL